MKVADLLMDKFMVLERKVGFIAVEIVSVDAKKHKIRCRPLEGGRNFTGVYNAAQIGSCDVFLSEGEAIENAKRRNG